MSLRLTKNILRTASAFIGSERENIFLSKDFEPGGKYCLQLFCTGTRKFVSVELDDYLPLRFEIASNKKSMIGTNTTPRLKVVLAHKHSFS
jgi:hypothetical protein